MKEEEIEMSDIVADVVELEEELQVGDGVAGSWARVGRVSGLL